MLAAMSADPSVAIATGKLRKPAVATEIWREVLNYAEEDGEPIPGARVWAREDPERLCTITDAEGRFEIELPTVFCAHCHCSMCRRPHGASFVTWTAVPPERFFIVAGEEHLKTYESSPDGRRQFCDLCGTQLFCWHISARGESPKVIDVTLASLDGPIDRPPSAHVYFDSRAEWTVVNDDLPKLGGTTGMEPLTAEIQEE